MKNKSPNFNAVRWTASDLQETEIDSKLFHYLNDLGACVSEKNMHLLSQALEWTSKDVAQYSLVENNESLPDWWAERNNKLFIPKDSSFKDFPEIRTHPGISSPENCTVFLCEASNYSILIWGSDSVVYISPDAHIPFGEIAVGNGFVFIGPDVRSTARLNINCRNGGSVILTEDILIGSDVKFQSDDCHTIISLSSNERLNPFGGTIVVRNHVWFGEDSLIFGDSYIEHNCIIGARSFVRGIATPSNSIIAGVPGKVIRTDITWDSRDLPPNHVDLSFPSDV